MGHWTLRNERHTTKRVAPIHNPKTETTCFLSFGIDSENAKAVLWIQKTSLNWFSSMSWSIVLYAALRLRRVQIKIWSESVTDKWLLKTWSRAVTVPWLLCQLKNLPQTVVFEVYKQLRRDLFSSPAVFTQKAGLTQVWNFLRMLGSREVWQWPVSMNLAQNLRKGSY